MGEAPWQPHPSVLAGQILERKKHPRVGLLNVGSRVVLFRQFQSAGMDSVWAYAEVTPAEVWALQDAIGPVAFSRILEGLFANRRVTVALASDQMIVRHRTLRIKTGLADGGGLSFGRRPHTRRRRGPTSKRVTVGTAGDVQAV